MKRRSNRLCFCPLLKKFLCLVWIWQLHALVLFGGYLFPFERRATMFPPCSIHLSFSFQENKKNWIYGRNLADCLHNWESLFKFQGKSDLLIETRNPLVQFSLQFNNIKPNFVWVVFFTVKFNYSFLRLTNMLYLNYNYKYRVYAVSSLFLITFEQKIKKWVITCL